MVFESIDGQKHYHKLIKLDPISFRSPTLHPLTAPYAQTTPYPGLSPQPACRPPDTVVRRTQPILPCERARWLMLSGRCRRGGWRRSTGNSLPVGKPLPSATPPGPPVPPTHATGHSAFSKRCPFLQSRNGRFYAFRGVARRHVTTIDFQTRSTKINVFESIDGSKNYHKTIQT